jgi:hypothetical protein
MQWGAHWRGRGRYSIADSKSAWMCGQTWAIIAICANCSCPRGRRASSLAALQSRVSRCRHNNPNQGSCLVVAATDLMPAIAGSPTLQLLLRRGRDDAWLDLFQQGINSAHGCRRSVRPPVLRCACGHLSAVVAAPKPAKLAPFYSGANNGGLFRENRAGKLGLWAGQAHTPRRSP